MRKKNVIASVVVVLLTSISIWLGPLISNTKQTKLFEIASNTSTIIFGIMGVWIGVLYPNIKEHIAAGKIELAEEIISLYQKIISTIIISVATILVCYLRIVFSTILQNFSFWENYKEYLRIFSFCTFIFLSVLLFYSLTISLLPLHHSAKRFHEQKDDKREEKFLATDEKVTNRGPIRSLRRDQNSG